LIHTKRAHVNSRLKKKLIPAEKELQILRSEPLLGLRKTITEREMGIFTKNRTSNIGLDVSSTAVKLLEFAKELVDGVPRYRILNYAVVPLPTNAIVEKSVADV